MKSLFTILFLAVISSAIFPQTPADKAPEKQEKLIFATDRLLAESTGLRLAANRAYVLARAGKFLCKVDRDRATEQFRLAVGELATAQATVVDLRKGSNLANDLNNSSSIRPTILRSVAECDAELALQSLNRTRPPMVESAMSGSREKTNKIGDTSINFTAIAQNETALEQSIIRLAAEQNPDRASALLKESLKKGLTSETFSLLQRLNAKEPEEASRIANSVVENLSSTAFAKTNPPNYQGLALVSTFLSDYIRTKGQDEKFLKYDDAAIRSLEERAVAMYLEQRNGAGYVSSDLLIKAAEKLSPGNVLRLRAQEKALTAKYGGITTSRSQEMSKLMSSNPTAERLVSESKNYSPDERRQLLYSAAYKFADRDDYSAAAALVNENFSDDVLENAIQCLNWYYAHRLMNLGKYSEAERMMNDFPENNRNAALMSLAQVVFDKDKEKNGAYAVSILNRIRASMPERPPTQQEMGYLLQLVNAYTKIEPEQAFDMVETLVPQINELCDASIVIASFQGGSNMEQGEGIVAQGLPYGFYVDYSVIQKLADKDLDRTEKLIEQFSRPEMRVTLKMQLAENLANKQPAN
jgi:hypothetical protein